MTRIASLAAAALLSATAFAAAPAAAQGGYFNATFAAKPAKASFVTRSTVWRCSDSGCVAGKSSDRPAIVCELVARDVGALTAFSANGTTFDADALAKCNAKAK